MSRDDQGAVRVAFALVNTLPCGPDNVDLLYNEGMARHLVRTEGVTLPVRDLHASGAITRLGWCAARWCGRPFLAPARGRPQRFCSPRCANWVRQSRGRHGTERPYVTAPSIPA